MLGEASTEGRAVESLSARPHKQPSRDPTMDPETSMRLYKISLSTAIFRSSREWTTVPRVSAAFDFSETYASRCHCVGSEGENWWLRDRDNQCLEGKEYGVLMTEEWLSRRGKSAFKTTRDVCWALVSFHLTFDHVCASRPSFCRITQYEKYMALRALVSFVHERMSLHAAAPADLFLQLMPFITSFTARQQR
jgi:hypothetical protein